MNTMEEKLWNYIDGTCTPAEQEAVGLLIAKDDAYRVKYNELLALNTEFKNLELDEPSMAFTYNVMEAVRAEAASVPLKSAINKNVIRALVGAFVGVIIVLIAYALFMVNWNAGGADDAFKMPQFKMPGMSGAFKGGIFKAFIFLDIVLMLFLGDAYLRRQRSSKSV